MKKLGREEKVALTITVAGVVGTVYVGYKLGMVAAKGIKKGIQFINEKIKTDAPEEFELAENEFEEDDDTTSSVIEGEEQIKLTQEEESIKEKIEKDFLKNSEK